MVVLRQSDWFRYILVLINLVEFVTKQKAKTNQKNML